MVLRYILNAKKKGLKWNFQQKKSEKKIHL